MFLLVNSVFAVEISQVLFDPENESGGEAVELFNPSAEIINISGWYLETERSKKDAILPQNTFIQPNNHFLITDLDWNKFKDNSYWKNSNYEESITLKNENSFVRLNNNFDELIDIFEWDSKQEWVNFFDNNAIPIELIVENEELIILDESNKTGIQILGNTKYLPLRVYSEEQPKIHFLDELIFMNDEKNGYYNSSLNLTNLRAGNYSFKINNETINFEYLRFENYEILTKKLVVKNNGILELKNKGNVPLNLTLHVDLSIDVELKTKKLFLDINEEKEFILEFNVKNVNPGTYQGVLIIE